MTNVTLWRMRRPSDGGEVACSVRLDAAGVWYITLTFEGVELQSVARQTRCVAGAVGFAEETRRNLL